MSIALEKKNKINGLYISEDFLGLCIFFLLFLFVYLLNAFSRHRFSDREPYIAKSHLTSMPRFLSGCALLYLQTTNLDQVFFSYAGVCKPKGLKLSLLLLLLLLSFFVFVVVVFATGTRLNNSQNVCKFEQLGCDSYMSISNWLRIALILPLIVLQNYNRSQYLLSHFCFLFFIGLNQ